MKQYTMTTPNHTSVTEQTRDYYAELLSVPPDTATQLCAPKMLFRAGQYAGGLAVHTFRHGKAESELITAAARSYVENFALPIAATMAELDPRESNRARLLPRPDSLAKNVLPTRHKTGRLSSLAIRALSPAEMPVQGIPYPALARDPLIQNEDGSYWHEPMSAFFLISGRLSAGTHKKLLVGCGLLLAAGLEDPSLCTLPYRERNIHERVIFKDSMKGLPERDSELLAQWHTEA